MNRREDAVRYFRILVLAASALVGARALQVLWLILDLTRDSALPQMGLDSIAAPHQPLVFLLSVPCVLDSSGIADVIKVPLNKLEQDQLAKSVETLKGYLK